MLPFAIRTTIDSAMSPYYDSAMSPGRPSDWCHVPGKTPRENRVGLTGAVSPEKLRFWVPLIG